MNPIRHLIERFQRYSQIVNIGEIARRYFAMNAFDGVLTIIGVLMGNFTAGVEDTRIVVTTGLATCVAMGVSGLWGAYLTEAAERQRELQELEADARVVLVARKREAIVGVCRLKETPDDAEAWMVLGLAVHPAHRRQGIGRALVQAGIDVARSRGGRTIRSEAHEDNRDSMAFHRAVGFRGEWRFTASDGDEKVGFSMPV